MKRTEEPSLSGILLETLSSIGEMVDGKGPVTVERVVLGLFFTGVKLSNGHAGVCYTTIKSIPEAVCCPSSARAIPTPGRLRGRNAVQFAEEALSGSPLQKAAGIAVMNALQQCLLGSGAIAGPRCQIQ